LGPGAKCIFQKRTTGCTRLVRHALSLNVGLRSTLVGPFLFYESSCGLVALTAASRSEGASSIRANCVTCCLVAFVNTKYMDLIGFVCRLSANFICTWGRMDFGSLLVEQRLPNACLKNLRQYTSPWS